MRVIVVSSYPPRHCGIGAYAATQVDRLRADGHEVTVISPPDGEGDVRVPFDAGRPFREVRLLQPADRLVVHFQPALYYRPRAALSKILTSYRLWRLCRRRPTELLIHEADSPIRWRPDYILLRRAFLAASAVLFHTEHEHRRLERDYRVRVRGRLVDHRDGIGIRERPSREEARRALGLPMDELSFVCLGFLQPDKGIERAIEAIDRSGAGRLYILGSVKDRTPRNAAYAERIRTLVAASERASFEERFLDEGELDRWTAAADAVILPYLHSWSSGALARAQALGTPAIVADTGGLREQATDRDVVVRDDQELTEALVRLASTRTAARR